MTGQIGRCMRRMPVAWVSAGYNQPLKPLVLALAISLLAAVGATRLRVDADLAALLPRGYPSALALSQFEEKGEVSGFVSILVDGADAETHRRFAQELSPQLEALPAIRYVELERPGQWFEDRGLFFLTQAQLTKLAEDVEARVDWEVYHDSPLGLGLEDSTPPDVQIPEGRNALGSSLGHGGGLRQSASGALVLLAKPFQPASHLASVREVVQSVQQTIERVQGDRYPGLRAAIGGRYAKNLAQKAAIGRDLASSSALALALSLGFLVFYFRSLRWLALVLVPLLVGMLWAFGFAGAFFGRLNILTAFIGAILTGLGVDHGIHLASALRAHAAPSGALAITRAWASTGRSVTLAALTTAVGFGGIGLSELRAFREFGILAGAGMLLILLAYGVLLPPMWRLTEHRGRHIRPAAPGSRPSERKQPLSQRKRGRAPRPGWRLSIGGGLLLLPLLGAPRIGFNADLRSLEDMQTPAARVDAAIKQVTGASHTPVAVLPKSLRQEAEVAEKMRASAARPGSAIDRVLSMADLTPPGQVAKRRLLERIAAALERLPADRIDDPTQRERYQRLTTLARAKPFGRADLPEAARRWFYPPKASDPSSNPGYILAFPAVAVSDGRQAQALAKEIRAAAGGAPVAGESLIFADILTLVRQELGWICGVTLALVFFALSLSLRSWSKPWLPTLMAVLPIVAALGMFAWLGGQLNVLNIILIPVLFGIGVDAGVHLLSIRSRPASQRHETLKAIAASLLTTAFGFGALMLASNSGLRSLAQLALLGLGLSAWIALLLAPAGLALTAGGRPQAVSPGRPGTRL